MNFFLRWTQLCFAVQLKELRKLRAQWQTKIMLRLQLIGGMKHKYRFQIECKYFKLGIAQKNQSKE